MADDETQPPPAAAPTYDPAIINQMIQQMLQPAALPQQSQAPVERSGVSLLGEALGGGSQYGSPAERETAGTRALLSLGVGMLGASGYSPVRRTLGQVVAEGIGGAEQSLARSGSVAAAQLAAQQDYAKTQQEMQISRLKEVLPLLKMQAGMATPNTLLGSAGKPNTSIGAVGGDTYEGAIGGHEGTGQNPNSSAFGVGQFITPTWLSFAAANPELFKGMSQDQILAARSNPAIGAQAITWLAQQNADQLTKAGVTPSGPALGIAHYLGAGAAAKVLQAPDNAPVAGFVSDAAVKANPELRTMTVAQLKQRYANVPAPSFLGGPKPGAVPAPTVTAQAPPAAPAGPPGVAQGDAAHPELAPGPPGSKGGAPIGIGAALAPPVVAGTPLPAGRLQSTGKPPGQAAADIIQSGQQLAQATPLVRGTGQEAGPSSAVATLTTPATPQPGWGTGGAAGYNTGTTTAPTALAAPQAPTQAQQPPPVTPPITAPAPPPAGGLTFEQFQAQHPIAINPESYTVTPPDLTDALAAKAEAARQLSLARAGISGDPNKSLSDFTTASQNVTKLQQEAQAKSRELRQAAEKNALDTQRQLYDAEMQRQAQAAEAERQRQAAVALETQRGNQAIDLEKVKAGQTWHQKLEEQAATYAQENTIKPMAVAAAKAHQMNLGLAQMQALLPDLPKGGGALGAVLEAHPDLAPLFNTAGILTDKSADAVRLINGLVSNISTEMKPTGLGALREYEWDAFKAQLPSMLSTPAGQQKAVALLMNMNDRISSEHSWMSNYFSRKVPDETTPGKTVPAHNLESDNPNESVQQRMDRELGPIIPRYAGPPSGSGQAQWESSLPPGKPYYKTWAQPDPQHPGQPLRDNNGNIKTTRTLEIRPWQ